MRKINIVLIIGSIISTGGYALADSNAKNGVPHQLKELQIQQALINEKLDKLLNSSNKSCSIEDFINEKCTDSPISTTVSYCFEQGHAVGADMAYGLGLKTEVSAGAGWTLGPTVELQVAAEMPTVPVFPITLPLPLGMPIGAIVGPPIPTEAKISGSMGLNRGHSTCIEVPVTIPQEAHADLRSLLSDVNDVYQNRVSNLLRYGNRVSERRETLQCVENSFDGILKEAIQNVGDDRVGFLKDQYISSLLQCSELPQSLANLFTNPDDLFNKIPEIKSSDLKDYEQWLAVMKELDGLDVNRVNNLPSALSIKKVVCATLPSTIVNIRPWRTAYCEY